MKVLRMTLIYLAVFLIALNVLVNIITPFDIPRDADNAYIVGAFIGRGFLFLLSGLLFFLAALIKRRINKRSANALLESLPE